MSQALGERRTRLLRLQEDEESVDQIWVLLSEGKSLREIAAKWDVPQHRFAAWVMEKHPELVEKAERGIIHERMYRLFELSKDLKTPEAIAAFKAESEFIVKVARSWHREKYGEHVKVEKAGSPEDAAGVLTAATELLREIRRPEPRVIEAVREDAATI